MKTKLIQGDCLEKMKDIESGSIDLVLADPPYGIAETLGKGTKKYKDGQPCKWDSRINTADLFADAQRVLRQGGAMILFAQNGYANELQNHKSSILDFAYRAAWVKDHFGNCLSAKKAMVSYFEDVLIFRKKYDTYDNDHKNPLRAYARQVREYIGEDVKLKDVIRKINNTTIGHFFGWDTIQFSIPAKKHYENLTNAYNLRDMIGYMEHDELRSSNAPYQSGLTKTARHKYPPTFNLPENKKHKSNVLTYAKDRPSMHPTQKPVALLEDLIYTFSNEGDTVLDFTMGSGSTGVAAKNLNRDFVGIELGEAYFKIAQERIL